MNEYDEIFLNIFGHIDFNARTEEDAEYFMSHGTPTFVLEKYKQYAIDDIRHQTACNSPSEEQKTIHCCKIYGC